MTTPAETVETEAPVDQLWLTKREAADALGVTTKTIEQWDIPHEPGRSAQGRLIVLYSKAAVEEIAQRRANLQPGERPKPLPKPTVATAPKPAPANGTALTVGRAVPAGMGSGIEALIAALRPSQKFAPEKLFLTIPEAAAFTGLSQAYIRRLCQKRGKLKAIRDGGWKIPRKALQSL